MDSGYGGASGSVRSTRDANYWTLEQVRRYRGNTARMANRLMGNLQTFVPVQVLNDNPLMSDTWKLCQAVVMLDHAIETQQGWTERRVEKDRVVYMNKIADLKCQLNWSLKWQLKWELMVLKMTMRRDVAGICAEICR